MMILHISYLRGLIGDKGRGLLGGLPRKYQIIISTTGMTPPFRDNPFPPASTSTATGEQRTLLEVSSTVVANDKGMVFLFGRCYSVGVCCT